MSVAPHESAMREFTRRKQALALLLQELSASLRRTSNVSLASQVDELLVKLAENRFTLAVVGKFKRGKSTLINALIRRSLLPTGIVPLTSALTVLRYGSSDRLLIKRTGFPLTQEAPHAALSDFVTERGNPANCRRVESVWVETPARFLRRGLEFVDTPGIGSTIEANTQTTLDFIPRCDAVLLVTSVEAPMSAMEIDFLRLIRRHVGKFFFVLNKVDLADEAELGDVIRHTEATLFNTLGTEAFRLFPVSCRNVVEESGRDQTGEIDGLGVLRTALEQFLAEESTRTLLASVIQKARRICSTAVDPAGTGTADDLEEYSELLSKIDGNEIALADSILQLDSPETTRLSSLTPLPPATDSMGSICDWAAALRTRGCVVCDHLASVAFDFFCRFQYEFSTDARVQRDFAARGGFCAPHAWQLASGASPHGLSSGLPPFAQRIARELASQSAFSEPSLSGLMTDASQCTVCNLLKVEESSFLDRLGEYIANSDGANSVSRSHGPCLVHLERLLHRVSAVNRRHLLRNAARRFDELAEDMRSFVLKRDALRRPLINGDEEDAYRRVLIHLFGDRRVIGSR